MLVALKGFTDDVVAVRAVGKVTRHDYASVLVPAVEAAARRHEKLRFYYEIGADFNGMEAGAAWEDFKVGIGFWTRWERVAVVTDLGWVRHAVNAFGFLMPGEARVFPIAEKEAARAWLGARTSDAD